MEEFNEEFSCFCTQDHAPYGHCLNASVSSMCDDCVLNCAVGKIETINDIIRVYGSDEDKQKYILGKEEL